MRPPEAPIRDAPRAAVIAHPALRRRARARWTRGRLLAVASGAFAIACLGLFVVTPLDLRTQIALAAGTLLLALLLGRRRGRAATLAPGLVSVAVTGRDLYLRISATRGVHLALAALLRGG